MSEPARLLEFSIWFHNDAISQMTLSPGHLMWRRLKRDLNDFIGQMTWSPGQLMWGGSRGFHMRSSWHHTMLIWSKLFDKITPVTFLWQRKFLHCRQRAHAIQTWCHKWFHRWLCRFMRHKAFLLVVVFFLAWGMGPLLSIKWGALSTILISLLSCWYIYKLNRHYL